MVTQVGSYLKKIIHTLTDWLSKVAMVVIMAMMLVTAADVILRYILGHAIKGSTDLMETMLVVMAFCAIALTQALKSHIRVELLVSRLPKRIQGILGSLTLLFAAGIYTVVAWQLIIRAWDYLFRSSPPHTITLDIPHAPLLFVAGIGTLVFTAEILVQLFEFLAQARKRETTDLKEAS